MQKKPAILARVPFLKNGHRRRKCCFFAQTHFQKVSKSVIFCFFLTKKCNFFVVSKRICKKMGQKKGLFFKKYFAIQALKLKKSVKKIVFLKKNFFCFFLFFFWKLYFYKKKGKKSAQNGWFWPKFAKILGSKVRIISIFEGKSGKFPTFSLRFLEKCGKSGQKRVKIGCWSSGTNVNFLVFIKIGFSPNLRKSSPRSWWIWRSGLKIGPIWIWIFEIWQEIWLNLELRFENLREFGSKIWSKFLKYLKYLPFFPQFFYNFILFFSNFFQVWNFLNFFYKQLAQEFFLNFLKKNFLKKKF